MRNLLTLYGLGGTVEVEPLADGIDIGVWDSNEAWKGAGATLTRGQALKLAEWIWGELK